MGVNPKLLRRSPLFADLPAADVNAVAEMAEMRWFDRGQYLYRQGEVAEAFQREGPVVVRVGGSDAAGRPAPLPTDAEDGFRQMQLIDRCYQAAGLPLRGTDAVG